MSEKEYRVLKAIIQQNDITAKGLVDVLGVSEKTVKRAMNLAQSHGLFSASSSLSSASLLAS